MQIIARDHSDCTLDGLGSFGTRKLELVSITYVRGM